MLVLPWNRASVLSKTLSILTYSFFSQSTLLIQCSSPKSFYSDLSIWTLSRVFFSVFPLQNLLRFQFLKLFRTLFPREVWEKLLTGFSSFIVLSFFSTTFTTFSTVSWMTRFKIISKCLFVSELFNFCCLQHILFNWYMLRIYIFRIVNICCLKDEKSVIKMVNKRMNEIVIHV